MAKERSWINWDEYSEDCEYFDVPTGMSWKGRAAIEEMMAQTYDGMGVEGTDNYESIFSYASDTIEVGWSRWYGVMEADMGPVPAKGKSFDVQGISIKVKDEDGKVVKHVDCWDALAQMSQFGVVPSFMDIMAGKTAT